MPIACGAVESLSNIQEITQDDYDGRFLYELFQEQQAINERLAYIADHIHEQPEVRIKYFVPDEHKSGGAILEVDGIVRKVANGVIVTADGLYICIEHMIALDIK